MKVTAGTVREERCLGATWVEKDLSLVINSTLKKEAIASLESAGRNVAGGEGQTNLPWLPCLNSGWACSHPRHTGLEGGFTISIHSSCLAMGPSDSSTTLT